MSEFASRLSLDQTSWYIYAAMVGGVFMLTILRASFFFATTLRSSERLHQKMIVSVLQAPIAFFDTHPTTSILNRFSKDIGCMDELLPSVFLVSIQMTLFAISVFLLPVILNPCVFLVGGPLFVLFIIFWSYYLKTARQVRKLEISCRRPVVGHFSETLTGLVTIRTHSMQKAFTEGFYGFVKIFVVSLARLTAQANPGDRNVLNERFRIKNPYQMIYLILTQLPGLSQSRMLHEHFLRGLDWVPPRHGVRGVRACSYRWSILRQVRCRYVSLP